MKYFITFVKICSFLVSLLSSDLSSVQISPWCPADNSSPLSNRTLFGKYTDTHHRNTLASTSSFSMSLVYLVQQQMPPDSSAAADARLLALPCLVLKQLGLVAEIPAAEDRHGGAGGHGWRLGPGSSPRTSGAPGQGAAGAPNWIFRKALASLFWVWRWRLVCPPASHTLVKVSNSCLSSP